MQASLPSSFDAQDFHQRWLKARLSAFRKAGVDLSQAPQDMAGEEALIDRFFRSNSLLTPAEGDIGKDALLKQVFEHSRQLALSLSRHLGLSFEAGDFRSLLESSSIPCTRGAWETRSGSVVLRRPGCGVCTDAGAHACDYWREALDGLVVGLGETERLARHACARHGDSECVDVIFAETGSRKEGSLAWGPLPDGMREGLEVASKAFGDRHQVDIGLKGLNEGVLYYEMKNLDPHPTCWDSGHLTGAFRSLVKGLHPGLEVREVSPRPVLGVGA
ncbi:MAG: hypothetical protein AB7F75_08220 [Planctomycetota bacterium]